MFLVSYINFRSLVSRLETDTETDKQTNRHIKRRFQKQYLLYTAGARMHVTSNNGFQSVEHTTGASLGKGFWSPFFKGSQRYMSSVWGRGPITNRKPGTQYFKLNTAHQRFARRQKAVNRAYLGQERLCALLRSGVNQILVNVQRQPSTKFTRKEYTHLQRNATFEAYTLRLPSVVRYIPLQYQ